MSTDVSTYVQPISVKTFFYRMFHPHGLEASSLAGLIPASPEVQEREFQGTTVERSQMFTEEEIAHVIVRAQQVYQMYQNLYQRIEHSPFSLDDDENESGIKSLSFIEILVGFYIAMVMEDKQLEMMRQANEQQLVQ